jgi:hypothetical protein
LVPLTWLGIVYVMWLAIVVVLIAADLSFRITDSDGRQHSQSHVLDRERTLSPSRDVERTDPLALPSHPPRDQSADRERGDTAEQPPAPALPEGLLFIRDNESDGNYQAFNPDGCSDDHGTWSCGGAYQLSEQYASAWATAAGYPGMSSQAQTWPAAVQDAVALDLFTKDPGTWCRYTTYC